MRVVEVIIDVSEVSNCFGALLKREIGLQVVRCENSHFGMVNNGNQIQRSIVLMLTRDESFNSITGLNGSGKSNILDAICFVLGITNMTTVRAQNLQVRLHRKHRQRM
jgi:AAA15 family ATPase/GTPase